MFRWLWLLLSVLPCAAQTTEVYEVIAIEYPPFTTSKTIEGGLAFHILQQAFPDDKFRPHIVPPKRAYHMIQHGQWCLSFYPSGEGVASHKIILSEQNIVIGLIRRQQAKPFKWQTLDELSGSRIAILRSGDSSPFSSRFNQAGLSITYTESIQQSVDLVLRQRVDMAMYDDYNFARLNTAVRDQLQFSETSLLQTPVTLFTNPSCKIPLPKNHQPKPLTPANQLAADAAPLRG